MGIERYGLNPKAIRVMSETGIDISRHSSKTLDELAAIQFDYVVTVCSHAHETCPVFPHKATVIHRSFDDPPRLARNAKDEEEALSHYRRIQDEIRTFVETLPGSLQNQKS